MSRRLITTRIEVVKEDPIFEGLPRQPLFVISESHNAVVGPSFRGRMEIIASSPACKTQIIRYRKKPWYTFQGHIERGWEDSCPEAYLLWKNMFRKWSLIP